MYEAQKAQRASAMFNLDPSQLPGRQPNTGGFKGGMYNDGQGGITPPQRQSSYGNMLNGPAANHFQQPLFPQPSLGIGMGYNGFMGNNPMMPNANPYAMGGYGVGMQGMNMGYMQPNAIAMQGMNLGYMQPNPMASMGMLHMGNAMQPLNQGQIDMVERWAAERYAVMPYLILGGQQCPG